MAKTVTGEQGSKNLVGVEKLIEQSNLPGFEDMAAEWEDFLKKQKAKLLDLRTKIEQAKTKGSGTIKFLKSDHNIKPHVGEDKTDGKSYGSVLVHLGNADLIIFHSRGWGWPFKS